MNAYSSGNKNYIILTEENKHDHITGLPFFFKLVCSIILRLQYGTVILSLPDGRTFQITAAEETDAIGTIIVHDYAFAKSVILGGDNGFFESFANDQWSTPNLSACLYVFARNADFIQKAFDGNPAFALLDRFRHTLNKNTKSGSKRNIMAHYDLGNSFYEQWLDPGMTYSSALFSNSAQTLEKAQQNKYENLAKIINLQAGESLLEIGSGWGGFAEFAAKDVGAHVTGITISEAQYDYTKERIFKSGLNEKVDIELRDYRDVEGEYDKVASIEMFEAVGKEYWAAYFNKISSVLRPGGTAGIQVITIADRFFKNYEKSSDFIQRYVFPGGMLPSPPLLREHIEQAGLKWNGHMQFGQSYANTLNEWHKRFLNAWDGIRPLGFDKRFKKTWEYYLAYCEAGFRAATTDVYQLSVAKA